jgi:hypothetical protein
MQNESVEQGRMVGVRGKASSQWTYKVGILQTESDQQWPFL